jgi:GntR family transcriptional regulator/MocR family aminotransferase
VPGLRLAWLVLPQPLLEPVLAAKSLADGGTGALDQLTLAEFIGSGAYDRHVRRCRSHYRARRDRLVAALATRAPRVRVTGLAAGLHALVELEPGADESAIVTKAANRGLALDGLRQYGPDAPAALVVGYGTPPDHAFAGALDALCAVLA